MAHTAQKGKDGSSAFCRICRYQSIKTGRKQHEESTLEELWPESISGKHLIKLIGKAAELAGWTGTVLPVRYEWTK